MTETILWRSSPFFHENVSCFGSCWGGKGTDWLAVGDADDEDRLAERAVLGGSEDERVEDLGLEARAERCLVDVLDLAHDVDRSGFRVACGLHLGVHEADLEIAASAS